jgi:hypothetical protein
MTHPSQNGGQYQQPTTQVVHTFTAGDPVAGLTMAPGTLAS